MDVNCNGCNAVLGVVPPEREKDFHLEVFLVGGYFCNEECRQKIYGCDEPPAPAT